MKRKKEKYIEISASSEGDEKGFVVTPRGNYFVKNSGFEPEEAAKIVRDVFDGHLDLSNKLRLVEYGEETS